MLTDKNGLYPFVCSEQVTSGEFTIM